MIYWIALCLMRCVFFFTLRIRRNGVEQGRHTGGYLLACSHVSHLDPFCLSAIWPRKIGWMARVEFYQRPWAARLMRAVRAFPVNRRGAPVSAMKEALRRLARGEVVGVFPEGGIKTGAASVLRGAPIKRGVCLLAARSGRPVLPCIVAGADKFNALGPWLPLLRGRLWVYCGDFVAPVHGSNPRAARAEMAMHLEREFTRLFAEMRRDFALPDSAVP